MDIKQDLSVLAKALAERKAIGVNDAAEDLGGYYRPVAHRLMNSYALVCGEDIYRLCEIEFYHYHPELYPDPYAHRDALQRDSMGKWYCHRSGLDITFGDGVAHSGILLRAMESEDGHYVYGPINLRKRLFAGIEGVDSKEGFYLKDWEWEREKLYAARRYGINRAKDRNGFHDLEHRFYIKKELKHPKV